MKNNLKKQPEITSEQRAKVGRTRPKKEMQVKMVRSENTKAEITN